MYSDCQSPYAETQGSGMMRTKLVHFNDKNTNKILFLNHLSDGTTNNENRKQMKIILSKAIISELTEMQRTCIVEYYINNKKQKQIAIELGVNNSTVSRHIAAATKKLRNIASYYI